MKKVLFSARVLLVEGPSDLNVLRALFDYILSKKERSDLLVKRLKDSSQSDDAFALKEEFSDNILRVFSLVQCVSVTGEGNFGNAKNFCEDVNITFKVLTDNDDICQQRKQWEGKLESFMVPLQTTTKQNTFMWKNGTIEDALRTDSPMKISEILGHNYKTNCTGIEWEKKKTGFKVKLKRKINNEMSNNDYDDLFDELFNRIENNEESEFLEFFKFITDQDLNYLLCYIFS
ncbi:hypothetical protein FSP39_001018 [Pinctada imbricata]|uniref:Uncharacterized protein n=1 Tax=Pinctada imbricata TaxID=66713 RepID=A0AA88YA11_PINIB|nr:hypothetical protein FSP39_001018 [Pinctada imbricata]